MAGSQQLSNLSRYSTLSTFLLYFTYLFIFQFDISSASKFNPTVKVRTQEIPPEAAGGSKASSESTVSKSKNCAGVNCMPQPVPAPGSPECRPRYDGESCCPTWICASDDILAKSLFDKDNNWNVKHEYDHDMFDMDDDDQHDDFPPPTPSESLNEAVRDEKKEKFEQYAAKGKLDNTHNKNFISRLNHGEPAAKPSPSSTHGHNNGPSIANNYADFKRHLNKINNVDNERDIETGDSKLDGGNEFGFK